MRKTSENQLKAMEKYRKRHPEKIKHIRNKSAAKSFIKKNANSSELLELNKMIEERLGRDGRGS